MKIIKKIFEKSVLDEIKFIALMTVVCFFIGMQCGLKLDESAVFILFGLIGYQIGIGYKTEHESKGDSVNVKEWQEDFKARRVKAFATKVTIILFIVLLIFLY